jgi:hypothetical protein
MLSLTNEQMQTVRQAGALLAPEHRDDFLRAIAARLQPRPTDHAVFVACIAVLGLAGLTPEALAEALQQERSNDVATAATRRRRRFRQRHFA